MQIKVNTTSLLNALSIVSRGISVQTSISALKGIYFEAIVPDQLYLRSTDLEIAIEYKIKAEVIEEGVMVVPGKLLLELLKKLPETILYFKKAVGSNLLKIEYLKSEIDLHTYPEEQFSFLPDIEDELCFDLNNNQLIEIIRKISISFGNDINKPALNGAFVEVNENRLRAVSTDTYRLSLMDMKINLNLNTAVFNSFIIPSKALNEIARQLFSDEKIKVSVDERQIQFIASDIILKARLNKGSFPPYQSVIPNEYLTKIEVNTNEFLMAVERALILSSDDKTPTCPINLVISDDQLILESQSATSGKIKDNLYIEKEGKDLNISFNGFYLRDILKVIDSENTIIELNDMQSPGIIKPQQKEMNYLSLILPIRFL